MQALVYCIFGAIINPESFLSLAAGAATFVAFVVFYYKKMKEANKSLKEMVFEVIDD